MVNESLPQAVWGESFAGFSCLSAVFARAAQPRRTLKPLSSFTFPLWHVPCKALLAVRLGRAVRQLSGRALGEARSAKGSKNGQYAAGRFVATGRARTRARRGREQHRQYEHRRLQGRRLDLRGISVADR